MSERTGTTGASRKVGTDAPPARSLQRPAPHAVSIPLPSTALQAGDALEKIMGAPLNAEAVAALNAANAALLDLSPAGLMEGLGAQLVVMRALSTKLISQAMCISDPRARADLLKTALQASREMRELTVLMRDLKAEARAEAGRTVDDGAG